MFPWMWEQDPAVLGATVWREKRRAVAVQDVAVLFPLEQSLWKR